MSVHFKEEWSGKYALKSWVSIKNKFVYKKFMKIEMCFFFQFKTLVFLLIKQNGWNQSLEGNWVVCLRMFKCLTSWVVLFMKLNILEES